MRKKKILFEIIMIVIIALISIGIYIIKDKNETKKDCKDKSDITKVIPELTEDKIQSADVDGMNIKMIGCVYDPEPAIGIAVFEIISKDIKDEKDGYFLHNGKKYFIMPTLSGGMIYKTKKHGDRLYLAIYFNTYPDEDSKDSGINMGIYEYVSSSDDMKMIEQFELNDKYKSGKVLKLECDDTSAISSLGIQYASSLSTDEKLTLIYKDGDEKVIDTKNCSYEKEKITIEFCKIIDIDELKSVVLKGIEYTVTDYKN